MKISSMLGMVSGAKTMEPVETSDYQASSEVVTKQPVTPVTNIDSASVGQNKTGSGQSREEVSEAEADRRMKSVIDQANEKVKHTGTRQLAFSYNENTKRISIKVYDSVTKEIIREIPPEKTLEMLERVYDLAGIMVDEKR